MANAMVCFIKTNWIFNSSRRSSKSTFGINLGMTFLYSYIILVISSILELIPIIVRPLCGC